MNLSHRFHGPPNDSIPQLSGKQGPLKCYFHGVPEKVEISSSNPENRNLSGNSEVTSMKIPASARFVSDPLQKRSAFAGKHGPQN